MIGEKEVQRYRDMSLEEKLREFDSLMEAAFAVLNELPQEERQRRWEIWMRSDEEAAEALAKSLSKAGK
ncbi:MAG: hypothetical protein HY717_23205 [Planctomycetes bacterium]|nr:hypothetical protein [Planctomycetota bacterium]